MTKTTEHSTKKNIYIGCSLTHAPEEFKTKVEDFKAALRNEGYEVLDFLGVIAGTPREVYDWDIKHCVADCDGFIGICDEASIGLGWELGEAVRLGKPCLAVAHADARVTRLVLGAAEAEPNLRFATYEDLTQDIMPLVAKMFTHQQ